MSTKKIEMMPPMCHCIICHEFMGETNPRQYCYKSYCPYLDYDEKELYKIQCINLKNSPYMEKEEYKESINAFLKSKQK